jgi:hypothetical protein
MTRQDDFMARAVDVNWDDPQLQDLLKKTEGLRLDDRNTFHARWVKWRLGWHQDAQAASWQAGLLVWDDHQGRLVLQTRSQELQAADPVAVDLAPQGMPARIVLGEVLQSRPGQRAEDQGREVFFTSIQVFKKTDPTI